MNNQSVNNSELKLLKLIWQNQPIKSPDLVGLAYKAYGWKKSTVYTIIKKLSEKAMVKNEQTVVTSLVSREIVCMEQSGSLIDKAYDGSLKLFLAAFLSKEKLSAKEAEELKQLIDSYTKEGN